jgi:hypothetical protein
VNEQRAELWPQDAIAREAIIINVRDTFGRKRDEIRATPSSDHRREEFCDRVCGQFARAQRVINSFPCERFDHAGSVADEEEIFMSGGNLANASAA